MNPLSLWGRLGWVNGFCLSSSVTAQWPTFESCGCIIPRSDQNWQGRNLLACCGKQRAGQEIMWAGLQAQASQLTLAFHKLFLSNILFTLSLYSLSAMQMVLVFPLAYSHATAWSYYHGVKYHHFVTAIGICYRRIGYPFDATGFQLPPM